MGARDDKCHYGATVPDKYMTTFEEYEVTLVVTMPVPSVADRSLFRSGLTNMATKKKALRGGANGAAPQMTATSREADTTIECACPTAR